MPREDVKEFLKELEETPTIQDVVGKQLLDLGLTIATAESCTGGLIADKLSDVKHA